MVFGSSFVLSKHACSAPKSFLAATFIHALPAQTPGFAAP